MKLYHASLLYMQQLEGEDEEEVEEKDRRRMEKKKVPKWRMERNRCLKGEDKGEEEDKENGVGIEGK